MTGPGFSSVRATMMNQHATRDRDGVTQALGGFVRQDVEATEQPGAGGQ